MNTKQVICIRKDLHMRRGKECSQAAHSSMKVFFDRGKTDENDILHIPLTLPMKEWVEGIFTKITCVVESEQELQELYDKAVEANIPCSMIEDNGLTEFKGIKTKTCIAIGPDDVEKIDIITRHLKLY